MEQNNTYAFGPFRLDTATQLLCNETSCTNLSPKVYRLLLYFLLHSGRLVSHEELFNLAPTWLYQMLTVLNPDEVAMLYPKVSHINTGRMLREGADFFERLS